MSEINFSFTDLRKHWNESEEKEQAFVSMLTSHKEDSILEKMTQLYMDLKNSGWQEIIYCPKNGECFLAIETGSAAAFICNYQADPEWPRGSWWAHCHGDMWPCRPLLWKPIPKVHSK